MRILLIDDDLSFAEGICESLYTAGNEVDHSGSMQESIAKLRDSQYDLIIIDLMLPPSYSQEGIEILRFVRQNPPDSEVLMISSRTAGMTMLVDQAYQNGARRFLDKSDPEYFAKMIMIVEEVKKEMCNSIFISHGHADLLKYQLKDFIKSRLGREALILSEQPNNGMTIVEKLEAASEKCNKAIILLTKDDEMADGNKRGRQNVIHEIGFFQGKYGRKNVILLCEEGVELFTNISGIVYIQFNRDHFPEVFEQLREELA